MNRVMKLPILLISFLSLIFVSCDRKLTSVDFVDSIRLVGDNEKVQIKIKETQLSEEYFIYVVDDISKVEYKNFLDRAKGQLINVYLQSEVLSTEFVLIDAGDFVKVPHGGNQQPQSNA